MNVILIIGLLNMTSYGIFRILEGRKWICCPQIFLHIMSNCVEQLDWCCPSLPGACACHSWMMLLANITCQWCFNYRYSLYLISSRKKSVKVPFLQTCHLPLLFILSKCLNLECNLPSLPNVHYSVFYKFHGSNSA